MMWAVLIALWVMLIIASTIWQGYVFSVLWAWFMVPIFGLPEISVPAAIGIFMIVAYLTHQVRREDYASDYNSDEKLEKFIAAILIAVFKPLIVLCVGWIVVGFL